MCNSECKLDATGFCIEHQRSHVALLATYLEAVKKYMPPDQEVTWGDVAADIEEWIAMIEISGEDNDDD